jgi:hypothetical protein
VKSKHSAKYSSLAVYVGGTAVSCGDQQTARQIRARILVRRMKCQDSLKIAADSIYAII